MNEVTSRKSRRGVAIYEASPFINALVEAQEKQATHTQFVKLYTLGAKVLRGLTTAGTKVFEVLYLEVRKHVGEDVVYLNFGLVDQATNPMAKATFMRGMHELLDKKFIAESTLPSKYFLNPYYVWNGDRQAFFKKHQDQETQATKSTPVSEPNPQDSTA